MQPLCNYLQRDSVDQILSIYFKYYTNSPEKHIYRMYNFLESFFFFFLVRKSHLYIMVKIKL